MHFTYADPTSVDLQQGDVIVRTAELDAVLAEAHPYYHTKNDYTHFLITTQTCDLVRRSGAEAASPYVSFCAVRPMKAALLREATRHRRSAVLRAAGANGTKSRDVVAQFLRRLMNNNNHEYFYLHEEAALGLTDRLCAFLRLSVALRAPTSYELLMKARVASLTAPFQAKLGWLVGNIYGRVGTDDWAPDHYNESEWNELTSQILDESIVWLDDEQVKATEKALQPGELGGLDQDALIARVKAAVVVKKKDAMIDAVLTTLKNHEILDEATMPQARARLTNSPLVASLFK